MSCTSGTALRNIVLNTLYHSSSNHLFHPFGTECDTVSVWAFYLPTLPISSGPSEVNLRPSPRSANLLNNDSSLLGGLARRAACFHWGWYFCPNQIYRVTSTKISFRYDRGSNQDEDYRILWVWTSSANHGDVDLLGGGEKCEILAVPRLEVYSSFRLFLLTPELDVQWLISAQRSCYLLINAALWREAIYACCMPPVIWDS